MNMSACSPSEEQGDQFKYSVEFLNIVWELKHLAALHN